MINRRGFVTAGSSLALAAGVQMARTPAAAHIQQQPVEVELPRGRVPLSFIIDDSTCLVNMGKFCMPQFSATYPNRKDYQKPWHEWPDEIPDAFVREFGTWCAEQGVKGKYSVVPYPACVGWLDRTLPGWSQKQLRDSLQLVRDLMLPNWDIHPEMITHTRVIDLKTGRPFEDYSPSHMENSYPQEDVSVDYLASYLAYALRILKNCDLPCEGITTPGGFGTKVKDKLPVAVFQAVRDVYGSEIPHYFKYIADPGEDPNPKVEALRDAGSDQPSLCMNVLAGTGDWFGGWDGVRQSEGHRYCNEDATSGRMVDLILERQPAIMLCHWPGMYCGGQLDGYHDFQRVVLSLKRRFASETLWMKVSEIGRYWAAKELTRLTHSPDGLTLDAPFECADFTLRVSGSANGFRITNDDATLTFKQTSQEALVEHTFATDSDGSLVCFHLPQGRSTLTFA